jgi:ribonuclease Z
MKKAVVAFAVVGVVAWLGYRVMLGTTAGQDFLLDRALEIIVLPVEEALPDGLQVFVCGSSSPLPDRTRAQACIMVQAGKQVFVVDAGAGSPLVLQLGQAPLQHLKGVLLTHFHSDHISALGDLNLISWIAGRAHPLQVFGGPGVETVVAGFNQAYSLDSGYRWAHHGKDLLPPDLAVMQPQRIEMGEFYAQDGLRITATAVDHTPVEPAIAYRFDYLGRSVVISGDTVVAQSLEALSENVDLLLHDALSERLVTGLASSLRAAGRNRPAQILTDVLDAHAHTAEVQSMAERSGARLLALYHMVPPPQNILFEQILRRDLSDDVVITHDGMRFYLPAGGDIIEVID